MYKSIALAAVVAVTAMAARPAFAQSTTTGSVGCAALAQAAANGMTARMAADQNTISQPKR